MLGPDDRGALARADGFPLLLTGDLDGTVSRWNAGAWTPSNRSTPCPQPSAPATTRPWSAANPTAPYAPNRYHRYRPHNTG